jgi:uncharacterized membrane protein YphA (DoxX/SURF4 family)
MMEKLEKLNAWAPVVVRVGVSLVFLWFGSQQLLHTSEWVGLIPDWVPSLSGLTAATLIHFNGAFEIVFGICLLVGYFTRISALLLGLHMLHIMTIVGYNDIGVRDFGLAMATISVFLHGMDKLCLDSRLTRPTT